VSKGKRQLSPEERALWRRVADGVKTRPKPRNAEPAPELATEAPVVAKNRQSAAGGKLPAARPSASSELSDRGGEKRVRRGRVDIGGTLDLHGHTQTTARRALARFVASAFARGERAIIVVTGVGRSGEGVLRKRLPEWLGEGDLRSLVSGFAGAHRSHGGSGAFYVFLKPNRDIDAE
jgi:DNA-nicking Smr family endonuclease